MRVLEQFTLSDGTFAPFSDPKDAQTGVIYTGEPTAAANHRF
jgi:hypothetical protein